LIFQARYDAPTDVSRQHSPAIGVGVLSACWGDDAVPGTMHQSPMNFNTGDTTIFIFFT